MISRRLCAGMLVLVLAGASAAGATTDRATLTTGRTFRLQAGGVRTFRVAYPDALKYGRSKYSGGVRILLPTPGGPGSRPSLQKVHILSRGSCLGGSDLCARVRNSNPTGTAAVRVRIHATTELPPGKHH